MTARALELTPVDFRVICGLRTPEEQAELYRKGASLTLDSYHLVGRAVDLAAWVDGDISWDWPYYHEIAQAMFEAAREQGQTIRWGGNWLTYYTEELDPEFQDGGHFELRPDLSWEQIT